MATTWLGNMWTGIKNVFEHEVFPWFENLISLIALDNLAKLKPIAETAIAEVAAEAPLVLTNHNDFLKAFNATVAKTVQGAEAAALDVTTHDILTASQAALAAHPVAMANGGT